MTADVRSRATRASGGAIRDHAYRVEPRPVRGSVEWRIADGASPLEALRALTLDQALTVLIGGIGVAAWFALIVLGIALAGGAAR